MLFGLGAVDGDDDDDNDDGGGSGDDDVCECGA